MSSKITLKNLENTEFKIEHKDGRGAKTINGSDIAIAVDTINDFPTNPNDGDVCIVRDLNRGGTFIYDSTEVANSNDGTNFNGWIRQYSGAVNVKWFGFSESNTAAGNSLSLLASVVASKDVIIPSGIYDCDDVTFPTQVNIKGSGDSGQCVIRNQSASPLFTFQDKFEVNNISFIPQGISPIAIKATSLTYSKVWFCSFDLQFFTGVVPTDLTSSESRCIELPNCSNVDIQFNRFLNGWNDKAYNASTAYEGNNVFRMVNCDSLGQNNVVISNNYFSNVWTAIAAANLNYLSIQDNLIIDTADTAIFDRCTVGETHTKIITGNKLKNIGKGGIKTLDTNNPTETAFGRNSIVANNVIENWGIYLTTAAIFAACHYDGAYVYSATHRARDLVVDGNILVETSASSCHNPLTVTNIDNAVVTNNNITLLDDTTDTWYSFAYSRFTFSNNVLKMQGTPAFSYPLKGIIKGNNIECFSYVNFDNTVSTSPEPNRFTILFDGNIVKTANTDATRASYGIRSINNSGGYGNILCINNTFETSIAFSDSNGVSTAHIAQFPTTGNIINYAHIDNNTVIFTDRVAVQKVMGGDILYPIYYSGLKGSATIDETTGVITYKRNTDRTTVNTITPTT